LKKEKRKRATNDHLKKGYVLDSLPRTQGGPGKRKRGKLAEKLQGRGGNIRS